MQTNTKNHTTMQLISLRWVDPVHRPTIIEGKSISSACFVLYTFASDSTSMQVPHRIIHLAFPT